MEEGGLYLVAFLGLVRNLACVSVGIVIRDRNVGVKILFRFISAD